MGRMEKRHDGLRVVGRDDFRVRRRQEFYRFVHVLQQRISPRRSSESNDIELPLFYFHARTPRFFKNDRFSLYYSLRR